MNLQNSYWNQDKFRLKRMARWATNFVPQQPLNRDITEGVLPVFMETDKMLVLKTVMCGIMVFN